MVQNYDGIAISQLGNTQLERTSKKFAKNVYQSFSQSKTTVITSCMIQNKKTVKQQKC